jgi:Tfp pilus assembly protein PilZ
MFIETQDKFCLGDCLSLSFEYKTAEKQVKAAGKVCKVNRHGIGVEFDADISSYLRN